MQLLLWALQSPINIGMILRSAEVYQTAVSVYDRSNAFARPDAAIVISDFACGALQRRPPRLVQDPAEILGGVRGRTIATAITPDATPLPQFVFAHDDVVLIGNEYDGLPPKVLRDADVRLHVPMPPGYLPKPPSRSPIDPLRASQVHNDGQPNLNVAVATSIVLYHAYLRSTGPRPS